MYVIFIKSTKEIKGILENMDNYILESNEKHMFLEDFIELQGENCKELKDFKKACGF